jgi:deoxyribodipyrimidine photo-lyase
MNKKVTIFWFRQDLRISDNPGLFEAAKQGRVLAVYILDDEEADIFKIGSASRWWLHNSLNSLNQSLEGKLNIYKGPPKEVIIKIIQENNVDAVYWNRCYEPLRIRIDSEIKTELINRKLDCRSFNGSLLWEPWQIAKEDGSPYKVYTPFYRKCLQFSPPRETLPKPQKLILIKDDNNQNTIAKLNLLSGGAWHKKLEPYWQIGENEAQNKLAEFLDNRLSGYKEGRNHPDKKNISRLSPHLHFGEISVNQVWHSVKIKAMIQGGSQDLDFFLNELGWREFSYYLLYHFPELPRKNFQNKFDNFPWKNDIDLLQAWQQGRTGYPIIDAGMRELWQTGFMHNRVRMIVASFLVKNLLLHWHHGEDWFWDCLVDADLASNSASWQWVAGSGADAAPYFRIFNPVLQGEKFDREGEYTRHFVPELSNLSNQYLFKPWTAPDNILKEAGIIMGKNYPMPIVSLDRSREEAMKAYKDMNLLSG